MTVYDEANNLARAIKESKEYLEYKEIKQKISNYLLISSDILLI